MQIRGHVRIPCPFGISAAAANSGLKRSKTSSQCVSCAQPPRECRRLPWPRSIVRGMCFTLGSGPLLGSLDRTGRPDRGWPFPRCGVAALHEGHRRTLRITRASGKHRSCSGQRFLGRKRSCGNWRSTILGSQSLFHKAT